MQLLPHQVRRARYLHVAPNPWSLGLLETLPTPPQTPSVEPRLSLDLHVPERLPDRAVLARTSVVFFSAAGQGDVPALMRELLASGPQLVLCTAAEDGCYVARSGSPAVTHHPAIPRIEHVADPVGAGDVFAATFLHYWYGRRRLTECVDRAQLQAAYSVTARGLDHLWNGEELERRAENLR